MNSLYLVTSGVPDRLTKLQNLVGLCVRSCIFRQHHDYSQLDDLTLMLCSKRTTNRILTNLASRHDDFVWESKRRVEIVMAAPTFKQRAALARSDNSGGISAHSDNVGKVEIYQINLSQLVLL